MSASPCRILPVATMLLTLMFPQVSGEFLFRRMNPDLDPKSDKEFFGPPFPADYPSDLRPGGKHAFNSPFPHIQGSSTFDTDYVKDENSDNGEWQAQMDYDSLRAQLQKAKKEAEEAKDKLREEADEASQAEDHYKDAKKEQEAAQAAADKAADDAKEAADKANEAGNVTEAKNEVPLEDAISEAKKDVEDKIKNLDDCKQQLIDAQNELKALLEESQKKREAEAAARSEEHQQAVAKHDETKQAADAAAAGSANATQTLESHEKLTEELKAKFEQEKAEEETAEERYKKEQQDVDELEKKLEAAENRLRAIRGGGASARSGAGNKSGSRRDAQSNLLSVAVVALAAIIVH